MVITGPMCYTHPAKGVHKMEITIKDVAREAGVAISTVSKVINGGSVRKENRMKVEEAIQRLGYSPNNKARGLRSSRTYTVGLLLETVEGAYWAKMVSCLEMALQEMGCVMILCCHGMSESLAREYAEYLTDQMVDGIFFAAFGAGEDYLEAPRASGIPLIALEDHEIFEADGLIQTNSAGLAYDLVEYLIRHGHRDIAIIDGPLEKCSARERLKGYLRVLEDYGITANQDWISAEEYSEDEGYRQMKRLWNMKRRPTAILAASYYLNMGVVRAVNELGIQIPGELSLVAVDDDIFPAITNPPITVGEQPLERMALEACRLLRKKLEGGISEQTAEVVRLKGRIIYRSSVERPRKE